MELKVAGNALVVTSAITKDMVAAAKLYAPQALKVKDDKGNEVFGIMTGSTASVSQAGVIFDGANAEGNLTATLLVNPVGEGDTTVASAKKKYGVAITNLAAYEGIIVSQVTEAADEVNNLFDNLEV